MSTTTREGSIMSPAILAISALAGCASGSQLGDQTRGFRVEVPPLGFDHSLQVRRSTNDVFRDLRNGASIRTGDRIRVSFVTSENAFLYLAFCKEGKLAVYPSQGGIRTKAGELMTAPQGAGELVVDHQIEQEVLYLILSRSPIAVTDPRLAEALAPERPAGQLDCKAAPDAGLQAPAAQHSLRDSDLASRDGAVDTSASLSSRVLRGTQVRKRPVPLNRGNNGQAPPIPRQQNETDAGSKDALQHADPSDASMTENAPPDPDFERSPGSVVWYGTDGAAPEAVVAADANGIAVVRYAFVHVASSSIP
jgi:hypothetical protein